MGADFCALISGPEIRQPKDQKMLTKITAKTKTKPQTKRPGDSATATPSKLTESMIAESMVVQIGLDQEKPGRMLHLPSEPGYVRVSLIAICLSNRVQSRPPFASNNDPLQA
jgi:hypothetical protein